MKKKRMVNHILTVIAVLITLIHLIPVFMILLNSMRTNESISKQLLGVPTSLYFYNFAVAWVKGNYASAYVNSLIVGICTSFIELFLIGMAVYGIKKTNCYLKSFFSHYFVMGLAIPSFAILVPLFSFYSKIGMLNTRAGMIVIYVATNMSFNYMFLSAFFDGMSLELDEAARIDGASELQNFYYNTLPLARPIFASIVLITFVNTWNEFMFSNTFMQKKEMRTVSLQFYNFVGGRSTEFGYLYAAAIIAMLPVMVIYLLSQDKFIEGMTAGSIKG